MNLHSFLTAGTLFAIIFLLMSCGSTDNKEPDRFEDGIFIEILELIGSDVLDTIETELEMPIHRGEDPPLLDVTVVVRSPKLLKTNVPNDSNANQNYVNVYSRFHNQDSANYTINFDIAEPATGNPPSFGPGSFIIGNGNNFTVFGFHEIERSQGTVLILEIFSGILTDLGALSPHRTAFMINNGGVSGYIQNGTGRSFNQDLGLAEFVDWPGENQKIPDQNLREDSVFPGALNDL